MPLQGPTRRIPHFTPPEAIRMARWIADHRDDAAVLKWLQTHRPRSNWTGTWMQYAYCEMPRGVIGRILRWLGA